MLALQALEQYKEHLRCTCANMTEYNEKLAIYISNMKPEGELVQLTKEQREWLEVEASNTTESHATIIRKLIQEKINND